jgi:ABC-type nitrate/sulfonate/bicarbonate transport system substrate-binding protein
MSRRRGAVAGTLIAAILALCGCGAAGADRAPNADATLLLDSAPAAVHAGIYMAVDRGYDDALGVNLRIRTPTAATDAATLLASGRTDLAIVDIHDLAIARERGRDLVGVMAIVQEPLANLRTRRVDDRGAPPYPELVLATSRATLRDEPGVVRGAVQALARGYAEVLSDPESAVSVLADAVPALDRAGVARDLDAVSASFTAGARVFGELDAQRLRAWARWEQRAGIVKRLPDVAQAFDGRYVPRSASRD